MLKSVDIKSRERIPVADDLDWLRDRFQPPVPDIGGNQNVLSFRPAQPAKIKVQLCWTWWTKQLTSLLVSKITLARSKLAPSF